MLRRLCSDTLCVCSVGQLDIAIVSPFYCTNNVEVNSIVLSYSILGDDVHSSCHGIFLSDKVVLKVDL